MSQKHSILSLNGFSPADENALPSGLKTIVNHRLRNAGPSSVLFYREPLHVQKASGARIHTSDGRTYLDFYNNVPSVGHSNPRVADAVARQMRLANSHSRYLYDIAEDYSERLLETFPDSLSNVTFTCSGSEANDLALRICRIVTGRQGIIVTSSAYHGNTSAVTEISPSSYKTGDLPPFVKTVAPPCAAHYGDDIAGGFARAVAEEIGELEAEGFGAAAFIADTIFSSDGVYPHPGGFLKGAVQVARDAGALFIADEVQPGFGRTGSHFWGFMRHGIEPDLVTLGKPMGNGYPLAGLVSRAGLLGELQRRFGYFNTFGGTPAGAAAGLAVLDEIAEADLVGNAQERGATLKSELEALSAEAPLIAEVRAAGLYLGVTISSGKGGAFDSEITSKIVEDMKKSGVLIGIAGEKANTLKIRPPLTITSSDCEYFLEKFTGIMTGDIRRQL